MYGTVVCTHCVVAPVSYVDDITVIHRTEDGSALAEQYR